MKKYNPHFPCYGQSLAGRIAYYQKMGVAQGIINMVKHEMMSRKLHIQDWKYLINCGNGNTLEGLAITIIIPTPDDMKNLFDYPTFEYNGNRGYIDMIHIDSSELQFHIMLYDRGDDNFRKGLTKTFINKGWHTVRECLSLEDTCTLFEYVEDKQQELIILPPEESDKYNSTGALGIKV